MKANSAHSPLLIWLVGLATFALLAAVDILRYVPPLPPMLPFYLKLPVGIPGRAEPLVATGGFRTGSVLQVYFQDEQTIYFSHLANGQEVVSPRITYRPGLAYPCRLEMPALATAGTAPTAKTGILRLVVNDQDVIRHEVNLTPGNRNCVYFGENPVAGVSFGKQFNGEMILPDGPKLQGGASGLFSRQARLRSWLNHHGWHLLPILAASAGAVWLTRRFLPRRIADLPIRTLLGRLTKNSHAWFAAGVLANGIAFSWVLTSGNFSFIYPDAFGAFYDFQAQSLLAGRWDVPEEALGGEAFKVGGKIYGYFGPTPALLRVPFVLTGLGFGLLTRSFLLSYFVAVLFGTYALLRHVTRLMRGADASPAPGLVLLALCATGFGSTLLFLASRAYGYHEALLCGVATAVWSGYFSLRHLATPATRWWVTALVLGTLSVQARPPTGLFALCLLGAVALVQLVAQRSTRSGWRTPLTVGVLAVAGLMSLQGVAYLKFGTFDGAPLQYHVQYTPERIAQFDGKKFHLANLPTNLAAYVSSPGFIVSPRFPYFRFKPVVADRSSAKIDIHEPAAAIPGAMAGLVVLTAFGCASCFGFQSCRPPMVVVGLATLPLLTCLLTFAAISHRYTADFCPPLIIAAMFGVAFIDAKTGIRRVAAIVCVCAATAFSSVLTLGLSLHFQSEVVWGVPDEVHESHRQWGERVDKFFSVPTR